ncbi:hypothetical protein Arash_gp171c [Salmonella phage Arash]|nr:hypothetical protein Arash_gp171c [Salmonella phage Arash]
MGFFISVTPPVTRKVTKKSPHDKALRPFKRCNLCNPTSRPLYKIRYPLYITNDFF